METFFSLTNMFVVNCFLQTTYRVTVCHNQSYLSNKSACYLINSLHGCMHHYVTSLYWAVKSVSLFTCSLLQLLLLHFAALKHTGVGLAFNPPCHFSLFTEITLRPTWRCWSYDLRCFEKEPLDWSHGGVGAKSIKLLKILCMISWARCVAQRISWGWSLSYYPIKV